MTSIVTDFATIDPFNGMTGAAPADALNLVGGKWVAAFSE